MKKNLTGLLALAVMVWATQAVGETTIRAVMHAAVKHLDPHWTTANITQAYSYMVYDTLFSLDGKEQPSPQMVGDYNISSDKLTYTFTLRPGLLWSDGKPVRAVDAVTSIKRWAVKDAAGQALMGKVASFEAVNDSTFVLKLKVAYGLVLRTLAKPYSYVPFILPERHAIQSSADKFTGKTVGSGPFIFSEEDWIPGAKSVFLKSKTYNSRSEPAAYFGGGKAPQVDRLEWIVIPDESTAVAALQQGEVEYLERPHQDQWPLLLQTAITKHQGSPVPIIKPNYIKQPNISKAKSKL